MHMYSTGRPTTLNATALPPASCDTPLAHVLPLLWCATTVSDLHGPQCR